MDRNVEWDAMKANLRGVLIQQISRVKMRRGRQEQALRSKVCTTEERYISERSDSTAKHWREAQEELTTFMLESAANKHQFLAQSYFEEEKAGHLLASIANAQKGNTNISALSLSLSMVAFLDQSKMPL